MVELDLHSVVVFRLGGDGFAIPVDQVREVVPNCWLETPPQMPGLVRGILNLGGSAIPVLRLDRLLGLGDCGFGLDASILVMRGDRPLGLMVEHVDGVQPGHAFQVMTVADALSFQGCLAAELRGETENLHLISWEKVLLAEERQRLDDFQRQTQARLAELADAT